MRLRFALLFALAFVSALAFAQEDPEGCRDSLVLKRMPGSTIVDCEYKDFDAVEVPVGTADAEGNVPKKTIEGKKEYVLYDFPETTSSVQIMRNAENALRAAGFTVTVRGKDEGDNQMIVARKGAQWVHLAASGDEYWVTTVRSKEMKQEMEANAAAWADAIRSSGRVAVHGINFDTGKATIRAESEPVLREVLALLNDNADWALRVEGHTDDVGEAAANQKLSEERAAAVVKWLASHGIPSARLTSAGRGEAQPAVANDSEEGRARNRRVELIKI